MGGRTQECLVHYILVAQPACLRLVCEAAQLEALSGRGGEFCPRINVEADGGDTAGRPAAGGFLAFAALRKKWRRLAIGRQNFGKASSVCNVRSQLVDNAAGAEF